MGSRRNRQIPCKVKKKIKDQAPKTPIIYIESKRMSIKNMQKTSKKTRIAIDKTRKICYNTGMRNNNNTNESNEMKTTSTTITYREWLIAREEKKAEKAKKDWMPRTTGSARWPNGELRKNGES
jgi:hypothetical protein